MLRTTPGITLNPFSPNHPHLRFFATPAAATSAGGDPGDQGNGEGQQSNPPSNSGQQSNPPSNSGQGDDLGEGGLKALQSERDARKHAEKENADLKAKIQAFEDANKSQAEKDAEEREKLQKANTENASLVLKYQVAEAKGLSLSAAQRLKGSTKEELEADADELKTILGQATPPPPPTPQPDRSQGSGSDKPKPKNLADAVTQHYA
ncbi:hypothetical protein [Brevibacterium sp. XM4083]|uniref:hypothetical protein n=1 Tax=Brevibacterium sp. XM4083 TaxID=2583238 RepID=UPI00112C162F|nr:hypothetical protein [Brevibacterium sp. XM4083]MCM1011907.1 hypothetical protein [Brevibacterium sp. XM4083]